MAYTHTRRPWRRHQLLLWTGAWLLLAAPASAAIRIELSGVEGDLRRNVLALLSLERYKDRDRIEADAVERLYRRVDDEVRSALKPFGYYEPMIEATLQSGARERDWRVDIEVTPGQAIIVSEVQVEVRGAGREDPVFARLIADPPIKPGQQLSHAGYEQLKSGLQSAAIIYGYLDARMLQNELQVDVVARSARVLLAIETGERYRFGETTVQQSAVREQRLRGFLRYRTGEPYDANKLRLSQFALDDTQYFSSVEVSVGEPDREQHVAPVLVTAEASRRSYRFGPGYGTDTGPRLTASMLNPRFNDRGHRLQLQLQASGIRQAFDTRYEIPIGDPARERFSLRFQVENQDRNESVKTSDISLTPSVSQVLGRWQRVASVAFARKVTDDSISGRQTDALIVPSLVYASVPEDFLGQDLYTRALYTELLGSHSSLGADANFLRLDVQLERRIDLNYRWHLLMRGEVGVSAVGEFQELPGDYRFFAGGDRSVRGFGYGALSPLRRLSLTDPIERVGGRHLLSGTVEIERDLPGNLGIAAFFDGGNAFDRFGDPLAYSAGLGLRWRLPGITIGIDVAQALSYPANDPLTGERLKMPGPRLHLNIAPRQ